MKKILIFGFLLFGLSLTGKSQILEDYLKIAAENNPGLKAKYKSFEASMQKVTQVGSLPDPNLSFGYFISPVETRVGPQRARFSLSQMFPWFGTLRDQEHVATLLAEANYKSFLSAKNQLFSEVSMIYFPLQELHELIAIEEENLQILRTYKELSTSKFENGQGSLSDVLRVDIRLADSESSLEIITQKISASSAMMNSVLGRAPEDPILISDRLSLPENLRLRASDAVEANPLLAALDLRIQASAASTELAQKQGMPKLGVGLDYVLVGERTDMAVTDNGKNVFMPMVTMTLPIFRGKYKGAAAEAALMQESYELEKQELENRLTGSFYRYTTDLKIQKNLIDLYENQENKTNQTLELLLSAYANSGKDFEEILRLQQQLLDYQKLKLKAMVAYHSAKAQLDYITAKSY